MSAISGLKQPLSSFIIDAPTPRAYSATAGRKVSTLTGTVEALTPCGKKRLNLLSSSASSTIVLLGAVEQAPTSMISAPSRHSLFTFSITLSTEKASPPSEKESGVTFRIPIM